MISKSKTGFFLLFFIALEQQFPIKCLVSLTIQYLVFLHLSFLSKPELCYFLHFVVDAFFNEADRKCTCGNIT